MHRSWRRIAQFVATFVEHNFSGNYLRATCPMPQSPCGRVKLTLIIISWPAMRIENWKLEPSQPFKFMR